MHSEFSQYTHIDRNRAGRQRNGIGKCCAGDVICSFGAETDDFGIDKIHHSGMEDKIENTKIGQKNLVEKPWDVAGKPHPADNKSRLYFRWKQQVFANGGDDQTGSES